VGAAEARAGARAGAGVEDVVEEEEEMTYQSIEQHWTVPFVSTTIATLRYCSIDYSK
jgi:hypothetical protein